VALVITDVSEEHIAPVITVTTIGELGTTLETTSNRSILRSFLQLLDIANVVPSLLIRFILMTEVICSSETSVLTRVMRYHTPGDGILHSPCRENLKSYIALTGWSL
jgi:hypothetical protein